MRTEILNFVLFTAIFSAVYMVLGIQYDVLNKYLLNEYTVHPPQTKRMTQHSKHQLQPRVVA